MPALPASRDFFQRLNLAQDGVNRVRQARVADDVAAAIVRAEVDAVLKIRPPISPPHHQAMLLNDLKRIVANGRVCHAHHVERESNFFPSRVVLRGRQQAPRPVLAERHAELFGVNCI